MAQVRGSRRPRLGRKHWRVVVVLISMVVLAVVVGTSVALPSPSFTLRRSDGDEAVDGDGGAITEGAALDDATADDVDATAQEIPPGIVVDVDGAVAVPGVYDLAQDARVRDAVAAAGGLAQDADTSGINLAAKVTDGSKVYVPRAGETAAGGVGTSNTGVADAGGGAGAGVAAGSGLVNINTASAEELETLPGVGPATATAIVEDRKAHGAFSSKEDLMRVSGIGQKKYAKLEGSICV